MYGTEFTFQEGNRVRLRDGVDPGFYGGMAKVGNEGWIRATRRDRFGLPEVYVEWDKCHWAYNHQPDKWTFEDHFDLVEEQPVSDQTPAEAAREAATAFADRIASIFAGQSSPAPEGPPATPEATQASEAPSEPSEEFKEQMDRAKTVAEAAQAIGESEAFMVVTITKMPHPEVPGGVMMTNVFGDSATPEAEGILGYQLHRLALQLHQTTMAGYVERVVAENLRGGDDSGTN